MPPSDDKGLSASVRLVEPGLQQRPQAVDNLSTSTCSNADFRFQISNTRIARYEENQVLLYQVRDTRYSTQKAGDFLASHSVYSSTPTSQGTICLTCDTDEHNSQSTRRSRAEGQADYEQATLTRNGKMAARSQSKPSGLPTTCRASTSTELPGGYFPGATTATTSRPPSATPEMVCINTQPSLLPSS